MSNRFSLPWIGLLCAGAWSAVAGSAEFSVHTQGELTVAVQRVLPGDVVRLSDGEWRDVDLIVEAHGTAELPITVAAETPGQCVITGRSRLRIAGKHIVVAGLVFRQAYHPDAVLELRRDSRRLAEQCRVTDCEFVDCNPPEDSREDAKYVSIYGRANRVDHCTLTGKRSRGTTLVVWLAENNTGGHQIDGNYFGPRAALKRNGGETIRIGDSQTSLVDARCVVENNLFERCSGEAEIISNKSCENVYRHNTFRGCGGALTLRHGHRCRVEGNWFLGEGEKGTGGVRVIGEGHSVVNNCLQDLTGDEARSAICVMTGLADSPLNGYSPVVGATIACNTILNCQQPLLIGFPDEDVHATVAPRDCLICNNLVVGGERPAVEWLSSPENLRGDGNWTTQPVEDLPAGIVWRRGQFREQTVDRDSWRRVVPVDPATGNATDATLVMPTDIEGQLRGTRPRAGCDEDSTAPVRFRPLTAKEVGPTWRQRAE